MVFGLGRKQETRTDLDANYYERQKAYIKGREDERLKNAAQKGREEAARLANKKPFYQKVMGVGKALGKDLIAGANQPQTGRRRQQQNMMPFTMPKNEQRGEAIFRMPRSDPFEFNTPKPRTKRRNKRRKK